MQQNPRKSLCQFLYFLLFLLTSTKPTWHRRNETRAEPRNEIFDREWKERTGLDNLLVLRQREELNKSSAVDVCRRSWHIHRGIHLIKKRYNGKFSRLGRQGVGRCSNKLFNKPENPENFFAVWESSLKYLWRYFRFHDLKVFNDKQVTIEWYTWWYTYVIYCTTSGRYMKIMYTSGLCYECSGMLSAQV